MSEIPIAVFIFNRPECTQELYEAIAELKPKTLFIIADGPREKNEEDLALCLSTRAIFNNIDWPCTLTRFYSEHNLGCRKSIPTGLDLVFQKVEECIILEDDCIPQQSFFSYCKELLSLYRDDHRIMCIGGHRSDGPNEFNKESYFFSKYPSIWGWATWKHKWEKYNLNMNNWNQLRNTSWLSTILKDKQAAVYWKRMYDEMQNGMDTWDYALIFSTWLNGLITIRPSVNMINNIGFGNNATHTKIKTNASSFPKAVDIQFPLIHPKEVSINDESENRIEWVSFSGMDKRILENARSLISSKRAYTKTKVLHLSTYNEFGGAARAANRIYQSLKNQTFEFEMLTLHKTSNDNSIRMPKQLDAKIGLKFMQQLLSSYRNQKKDLSNILQSYGEASAGAVNEINADRSAIIHLHWICNFLSIEDIANIEKPIVWTLHDMWPFCGSEHTSFDVDAYFYNEPTNQDMNDPSREIWLKKLKLWKNKNLNIVAPSHWLANCARKSCIFKNNIITVIPHPIDIDLWKPQKRDDVIAHFNFKKEKKQILFVANNAINDFTKGWDLLIESLMVLYNNEGIEFELVVLGYEGKFDNIFPFPVYSLGAIKNDQIVAKIYSAVHVIVVPSRVEAFSQVCLEAQTCALPVVGFDIGGIPDIVIHQTTGWISKSYDTNDLSKGIQWILEDEERRSILSTNARKYAMQKFSLEVVAKQYMNLYEKILIA
jgi:glycosyltransferase involved in cell wall biosynthesis